MTEHDQFCSGKKEQLSSSLFLTLLPRQAIDESKWDKCISLSGNESPLGYCKILDLLSPSWQGLIIGDYEGVMPIPVTKQLGSLNIQMPQEVISLGIFSSSNELADLFPRILNHDIFSHFKFINYNGSPSAGITCSLPGCLQKQTFELNLKKDYDSLFSQYSRSHRRNIRGFHNSGLVIDKSPFPEVFTLLIKQIGIKRPELYMSSTYQQKFNNMVRYALKNDMGKTFAVRKNNELIGGAFFLIGKKRIIPYHLANEKGRACNTSFALIDQIIKEYSGQDRTLDFAGSVLPNVADFNRRFGAKPVSYYSVTINRLPQPLKWAKEKNLLFKLKRWFFNKLNHKIQT